MQIAERLDKIRPSMTLAISSRAQELKAEGVPVISLAAGEPDFPTPQFVKDAAKKALDENYTRYMPVAGIMPLRKACAHYFERYYGVKVPVESVMIGAGGKQCLYTLIQTTINPGDEVIIPSPYWVSYPDMVLLAGGKPVFAPTSAQNGFKTTPGELAKLASSRTRMLILNSPCNPTGAVYDEAEFSAIMDWAGKNGIFVVSDEIYDQIVFKPAQAISAISWFAKNPESCAVVNGLSKSYSMTGWRMGFMAAHPELVKKMCLVQGHSLSNVTSITQMAALAALEGPDECIREMRQAFERRRNLAMDIIAGWPKAVCPRPDGAFYLFIDVSAYYGGAISGSIEFCSWLLETAHVAAVPGAAFGDDKCIRLSYAVSDEALRKALEQTGQALQKLA